MEEITYKEQLIVLEAYREKMAELIYDNASLRNENERLLKENKILSSKLNELENDLFEREYTDICSDYDVLEE